MAARHVAFLRGINLGGRRVKMDALGRIVRDGGFSDVATFLASGNVVFDGTDDPPDEEERRLERQLRNALGYDVDCFVRELSDVADVAGHDPFDDDDPDAKVHVMFFKEEPDAAAAEALEALATPDDRFAVRGREVYWFRRGRLTDATVDTVDIDRATGRRTTTMRTLNTLRRIVDRFGAVALMLALAACGGGDAGADGDAAGASSDTMAADDAVPEAMSLFGEPLYAMEDTTGAIAAADAELAADPDNVELVIAAGRVRRNFWQYGDAMELYTRAMRLAPDDWRPPRFRGHRYLSLRQFDLGIADLERARELAPLNWDVAYHLGLAYYLAGRFGDAADEYLRCLALADDAAAAAAEADDFRSCSRNASDPESRVAMTEWAVRAALRAGRRGVTDSLLASVASDLDVQENVAYYHDLLFYKGEKTADELLNPGPDAPYRRETVGYGVANWWLAQGDTAEAEALLEELVEDPWWPGFGRIAAEVELFRLRGR